jgi:branched-chain amino acid transport system ATP-binding protein
MAEPLLELSDIETSYGQSRVLFGISLAIAPGEMVSLMGRNGMGKTTTVRSIMGLTPAASGSIRFGGAEIRALPAYRVAKLGIGLVPEGRQIFPNLTARENLTATAANRRGSRDPWTLDKVCALFPRLAERARSMANLLSGGEQQMLAIGRALMTNPRLLILDEATEPGYRQECRRIDAHCRPPLHHRARLRGMDRHVAGIGRGAGNSAPLSRRLAPIRLSCEGAAVRLCRRCDRQPERRQRAAGSSPRHRPGSGRRAFPARCCRDHRGSSPAPACR